MLISFAQIQVPTEGHLILRWDLKTALAPESSMVTLNKLTLRKVKWFYSEAERPLHPNPRPARSSALLPVLGKLEGMQIKKARSRTERGVQSDMR